MTTRPAGPFDIDLLAAMHERCFADKWDRTAYARLLAGAGTAGIIASVDDAPCAFGLVRTLCGEAEILTLGVLPEHRGRGVGATVLDALTATAATAGARHVFLEVAEDNAAARALYARAGFVHIARRRDYYRTAAGGVDALVLRLDVDPPAPPGP